MDEMEIVKGFDRFFEDGVSLNRMAEYRKQLPDAVKREICRVLEGMKDKSASSYCTHDLIDKIIAKYSLKPTYCAGMQEAINIKMIVKLDTGFYLTNSRTSTYKIERCPFCEEGKNCIGENK